jgi:hypothetical protein
VLAGAQHGGADGKEEETRRRLLTTIALSLAAAFMLMSGALQWVQSGADLGLDLGLKGWPAQSVHRNPVGCVGAASSAK